MTLLNRWLSIITVLCLQLAALFYFGLGFFPKKLIIPGQASFLPDPSNEFPSPSPFNKLIFVVIDAFRSDFAFSTSSHMPFIHKSINEGYALGYTAFSTPPTVTLPRLKGLTTGSTPNFLDAVLNIAEEDTSSTLLGQDNWVWQLHSLGKKIHMFGDDTWIKLFPGFFSEVDGTASFFVSDFTEVDNNVTRHIDDQISKINEWDVLILHYLGLDHIGHKGGPESVFMPNKQEEMDQIIKKLFSSMGEETLLVVVGDHGMNEVGNHGGSSAGETSAATIFFSKKIKKLPKDSLNTQTAPLPISSDFTYFRKISQSDIVPTLSGLLNFPIPINSLGVFLKEFLPLWSPHDRDRVIFQNVLQISNILNSTYPGFMTIDADDSMFCQSQIDFNDVSELEILKCMWWKINESVNFNDNKLAFEYLERSQNFLSQASSNYKTNEMSIGLVLAGLSFLISISSSWKLLRSVPLIRFILLMITILYSLSMFGSSLVEEEHHLWYWGATGWISWLYILTTRKKFTDGFDWVIGLIIVRVIRSWNQTGQKHAGEPDIASFLSKPENAAGLWFLIILYYGSLFERIWRGTFKNINQIAGFFFSFITIASSISFKVNMACLSGDTVPTLIRKVGAFDSSIIDDPSKLISYARLSFVIIGIGMLYELSNVILCEPRHRQSQKPLTNMTTFLEALIAMQTRTKNIPLFIFFHMLRTYLVKAANKNFVFRSTKDLDNDNEERFSVRIISILSITILIFQHMSFFAMGNSNSLASIDLSNSYNGLSTYNIIIVGLLTFIGNWAGPLYWSATGLSILLEDDIRPEIIKAHLKFRRQEFERSNETEKNIKIDGKKLENLISLVGQDVVTLRIVLSQVFFSGFLFGILGACVVLKDHLFIWTVFSPKLLYAAAWIILQHCVLDVFTCTCFALLS